MVTSAPAGGIGGVREGVPQIGAILGLTWCSGLKGAAPRASSMLLPTFGGTEMSLKLGMVAQTCDCRADTETGG